MYVALLFAALNGQPGSITGNCGLTDHQCQTLVYGGYRGQCKGDRSAITMNLRQEAINAYAKYYLANHKSKTPAKMTRLEMIGAYLTSPNPVMVLLAEQETTQRVEIAIKRDNGIRTGVTVASYTGLEEKTVSVPDCPVPIFEENPPETKASVPVYVAPEPDFSQRMVRK